MATEELARLCIQKDAEGLKHCLESNQKAIHCLINDRVKVGNLTKRSKRRPNSKYANNETTCLNIACITSNASVVSMLLDHGARTDIVDSFGDNAFHKVFRTRKEAVEKLQLLLAHSKNGLHAKNKMGVTPLHMSAVNKNSELCSLLLREPEIDVNTESNKRLTPLHVAAHFGNIPLVEILLSRPDVDVKVKDIQGDTPMHHSACYGHLKVCEMITLHPNYDKTLANSKRITAEKELFRLLLREVNQGPAQNVQFLLENCKVPCSLPKGSNTALLQACTSRKKAFEKVKIITRHDRQQVSRPLPRSRSLPIHVASSHPDERILEYLLKFDFTSDTNVRRIQGQTPLHIACSAGLVNNVKVLLKDTMIDVNAVDDKNNTPLHHACFRGYYDIIVMLKSHPMCRSNIRNENNKTADELMCYGVRVLVLARLGYDSELQQSISQEGKLRCDEAKNNALHIVCYSDRDATQKATILIEHEPRLLQQHNTDGLLPIHVAIKENHLTLFNVFLTHCHHGEETSDGRRLLHVAGEYGCTAMARRLMLEKDLDVNARDSMGNTAAHLAARYSHQETLEAIQQHPQYDGTVRNENRETANEINPVNSLLFMMCKQGSASDVKSLLDNGAKCLCDRRGNTVLHAAYTSKIESIDKCNIILDHDPSLVNQANHEDRTMLHMACKDKNDDMLNFVLDQASVDLNAQDGFEMTPICVAIMQGYTKGVEILLNRNALINVPDRMSRFPLHTAVLFNELEILKLLLKVPQIDVNVRDDTSRTPWHLAYERQNQTALRYLTANPKLDLQAVSNAGISVGEVFSSNAPLADLHGEKLLLHKSFPAPESYYRGLTLISDRLYLSVDRHIHIYNLDLEKVDLITVQCVDYIRTAVSLSNGDLVVAAGTGLFHLSPNGEKKRQVSYGHYSHVKELNGRIYAIRKQGGPNKMCVCEIYDPFDSWRNLLHIEVRGQYTERSKVYVSDERIYIADGMHLRQFTHAGEDLGIIGRNIDESDEKLAPGVYGWPILSHGDSNDAVLLIDRLNHRLQVLHSSGDWSVVTLPPPMELSCGAVYVPGRLYVLSRNPGLSMYLLQP